MLYVCEVEFHRILHYVAENGALNVQSSSSVTCPRGI